MYGHGLAAILPLHALTRAWLEVCDGMVYRLNCTSLHFNCTSPGIGFFFNQIILFLTLFKMKACGYLVYKITITIIYS